MTAGRSGAGVDEKDVDDIHRVYRTGVRAKCLWVGRGVGGDAVRVAVSREHGGGGRLVGPMGQPADGQVGRRRDARCLAAARRTGA